LPLSLTPLGAPQTIASIPVILRLVSTAAVWYTCPVGKKAHITGYVIPDAFGAGTSLHVVAAGNQVSPDLSVVDVQSDPIALNLIAGETLGYTQDSGTNASVDGVWVIQESPA